MKRRRKGRGGGWLGQLLFTLSLVFLAFGLFNLGWAMWPAPTDAVQFAIPAGVLPGVPAGKTYASVADYTLTVSWPVWVRAGETGTLRVTLTEAAADAGLAAGRPVQVVLVEPAIAALPLDPPGRVQATLAAGQDLDLTWDVDGALAGEYPGKVIVSFGFYDEALAELVTVPVAVVDVTVRVTALWGLEAGLAVWFGLVGLVLWGALFVLGRVAQGR
jgi:hypothetical protein